MNRLLLKLTLWLHRLTVRRLADEFPTEYRDVVRRSGVESGELHTMKRHSHKLVDHDFLLDAEEGLLSDET